MGSFKASGAPTLSLLASKISPAGGLLTVSARLGYASYVSSTKADGYTMTAAETGMVVLMSTNGATINLPAMGSPLTGCTFTFLWTGAATETFNIDPDDDDKIMGSIIDIANGNIVTAASNGAGADGNQLQLDGGSKVGDRVTLVGDGVKGWYIVEAVGSWAFE